jgi:predicted phosphoribosyltransferase
VAHAVAVALGASLDVFIVRKLGVPGHEELAMGAMASGHVPVLNDVIVQALRIPRHEIDIVAARASGEIERQEREFRGGRPAERIAGRMVILVDDGLATGATMRAAARAVRAQEPARLVIAVPVAARESCEALRGEADAVVCAETPEPFHAVGLHYRDFAPTSDDEVRTLLRTPARTVPTP